MKKERSFNDIVDHKKKIFTSGISVECVIFGFHTGSLKVLLYKSKTNDTWMLPGGFIAKDEIPDETATRILKAKTGLKEIYLRQFYFFGRKDKINNDAWEVNKFNKSMYSYMYINSAISLAYYALIKSGEIIPQVDSEQEEAEWFYINNMPKMHPEQKAIFETAISTLRKQIGFIPIGYELLPEKFTMPELRSIYEAILNRELDRRNFQRKMLSIGYINTLQEKRKAGAHKAPNLYSFDKEKYAEADKFGIQIMSNNL